MEFGENRQVPNAYYAINQETELNGFTVPSDINVCSLLKTLAASKPKGRFLELGTGTGLSTSWILDGMSFSSSLISIDNDPIVLGIADKFLGYDKRLALIENDGEAWINNNLNEKFDFIFADTWHGKYLMLEETLEMLNKGGLYIVDDMLPQENWPEGHAAKAMNLNFF
ncbi:O-methyltransferase [Lacihabitans sp. LS3-19]|uniref:O-methyltransferase n=1 Tax=Lacihabitans sp. LS3-19 TaxID=2487335 RepID=UPI0020CC8D74|nr:class I SAM-dependent methyltransferase [Lacihabitans sp. LS3-19]